MALSFDLDYEKLATDARFSAIARDLSVQTRIDSRDSFNHFCREACRVWQQHSEGGLGQTSTLFTQLLARIEQGGEDVIQTSWGGVVITLHQPPHVEKYLAIGEDGYLALETHEQKDEYLEVKEGAGLLLWRASPHQSLTVQALASGDQFHFDPGVEHCLIGTENLLLFEHSTDPKGMDQDLIFIYEPDTESLL